MKLYCNKSNRQVFIVSSATFLENIFNRIKLLNDNSYPSKIFFRLDRGDFKGEFTILLYLEEFIKLSVKYPK